MAVRIAMNIDEGRYRGERIVETEALRMRRRSPAEPVSCLPLSARTAVARDAARRRFLAPRIHDAPVRMGPAVAACPPAYGRHAVRRTRARMGTACRACSRRVFLYAHGVLRGPFRPRDRCLSNPDRRHAAPHGHHPPPRGFRRHSGGACCAGVRGGVE